VHADLAAAGWQVSVNTVADSMRRQHLAGRPPRRRRGLTRPDKAARPFPDLLRRDFTAAAPDLRWVGDVTEIPTSCGRKLYLASVIDLYSRRLLAAAFGQAPTAELCSRALQVAVTARGGREAVAGVVFHTDRGATYTATAFTSLCRRLGVVQSMGRVGSCFDNAAAESFFSTLEHEVLSRHTFTTPEAAKAVVAQWCYEFYNHDRRHSSAAMMTPVEFERAHQDPADLNPEAA
jgi:transposase InsO family protein